MQFLRSVCDAVRQQVGPDFPVLAKLGMVDRPEGGLTPAEAMEVVAALEEMGLDGVEISGGSGGGTDLNTRKGIRSREDEAYFRPLARQARQATRLPILLVGGLRSREVMEEVLTAGDADFVSMCRPLISEPDLPRRLRQGIQDQSRCLSTNQCWPEEVGEGIACHCLEAPRRRKDG
jgi:2,4-dienoyl-CoA reductase-like NADH-dependent reductase (Old Yellow Enzyme family)